MSSGIYIQVALHSKLTAPTQFAWHRLKKQKTKNRNKQNKKPYNKQTKTKTMQNLLRKSFSRTLHKIKKLPIFYPKLIFKKKFREA